MDEHLKVNTTDLWNKTIADATTKSVFSEIFLAEGAFPVPICVILKDRKALVSIIGTTARTGHGKPGKSWNLNVSKSGTGKPGKSWNFNISEPRPGKLENLGISKFQNPRLENLESLGILIF